MKIIISNLKVILITFAINVGLDRVSKLLALQYLNDGNTRGFLGNILLLKYVENTGAFLSLGSNWNQILKYLILLIIPIIVCIISLGYCFFKEKNRLRAVIIITIVSGGLGNLFDRLFNNFSVIDFINFGIGSLRTGILNVADLSVTFGVIALVIIEFRHPRIDVNHIKI